MSQEISPGEIKELFPLARVDDLLAGFYVKQDGVVNPVDATQSIARGARMKGATIVEGVAVTGVHKQNGRVTGVKTTQGDIQAEYVVNCAGMWARQLGELSGVNIPNQAAEHYYLITEQIKDLPPDMPILEDPSHYGYYREEVGGLMVGLFEPVCAPWHVDGIPETFSFGEITPDWDRMGPFVEKAMSRVPITLEAGIKKFFCGPESFTPDLSPIVGEAPELKNYFVAAGLNSIGIIIGGGLGRLLAHLDRRRPARCGYHRLQHRPAAPLPEHARVPQGKDRRDAGHDLPMPLSRSRRSRPPGGRSGRPSMTGWPPTAHSSGRRAAGKGRTGMRRRARKRSSRRTHLGAGKLVPLLGSGAQGRP